MAQRERITTAEAIERLQSAFPYEPVEAIVRAEGDMSRTLEQLASAPLPDLSSQGNQQSQGSANQQGSQGNQSSQQGSGNRQQGQADPNDMNALIRQRAGGTTVTLPRSALTGIKDQAEYDPAADPFRSRYVEKYGS
jgi:hypothetical protein